MCRIRGLHAVGRAADLWGGEATWPLCREKKEARMAQRLVQEAHNLKVVRFDSGSAHQSK